MTFSALSFYYFILHFFFLARYWSTVRLTRSVNTDWHHGLCSRGGNKVSTQCFLYSVSLLLHQKTLAKSHLYFPCSWNFVIILIPTFSGFLYICISSAIVYFDTGQNISHDLYDLIETWDPIPGYLKKAFTNCPLDTTWPVLSLDFLTPQGSLLPQLFWTAEQVSLV